MAFPLPGVQCFDRSLVAFNLTFLKVPETKPAERAVSSWGEIHFFTYIYKMRFYTFCLVTAFLSSHFLCF